jgi:hypothetical protein
VRGKSHRPVLGMPKLLLFPGPSRRYRQFVSCCPSDRMRLRSASAIFVAAPSLDRNTLDRPTHPTTTSITWSTPKVSSRGLVCPYVASSESPVFRDYESILLLESETLHMTLAVVEYWGGGGGGENFRFGS